MQNSSNICYMVYVVLTIHKPGVWSMDNVVNAFPRNIEREQIGLRTVIHSMLDLTMAWFLNTMGPDLSINMWSLTVLNFFSLISISILRSLVTNFIQPYLHKSFDNSHCLNGYKKPLKRPFDRYQSCLEAINIG